MEFSGKNAVFSYFVGPFAWSLVVRIVGTVISFAIGVLLARVLNPEGLGLYGTAIAVALALSGIAQAGLPTLALREVAVHTELKNWPLVRGVVRWFPRVVLATSVLLALAFLIGVKAYEKYGHPIPDELLYAAPLVPLLALSSLYFAQLRALHRYVSGQALDILIRPGLLLLLCVSVYLWTGRLTPGVALALQIPAALVTLALGFWWLRNALPDTCAHVAPAADVRGWMRATGPLAISDILLQLSAVSGLLIVGAIAPPPEAGYLRVALSAIVIISTPLTIFNVVLGPRLAQLNAARNMRDLQRMLAYSAAAMSVVTWGVLLFLFVVGQPLIEILFGAAYAKSWAPLILLTAGQAIVAFFGVGWVLLSVSGGERKLAASYATSTLVGIVVAVLLAPRYGAIGAGWAALSGNLVHSLMCWYFVRRHCGVDSSIFGLLAARRAEA